MNKPYFAGYYFKYQTAERTFAFIIGKSSGVKPRGKPSCVKSRGKPSSSFTFTQVITDNGAYYFNGCGGCRFTHKGAAIDIDNGQVCIKGYVEHGELTPLKYDIMGPFRYIGGLLECRHEIVSMRHSLRGWLSVNGEEFNLNNGVGYIEGDSGVSFPKRYLWAQCNFPGDCSISLSVADIPFMGIGFTGCICAVYYEGKEYRLATYRGVKIVHCTPARVILRQGRYTLDVAISPRVGQRLAAPRNGKMSRTIRECIACPMRARFYEGRRLVFEQNSPRGSFECAGVFQMEKISP